MKIRNGFVSNSSSSSFVIRGAKFNVAELLDKLNLFNVKELDDLCEKVKFTQEPTGNYFGNVNYDEIVIGENIGYLEDGEVEELEDQPENDAKIIQRFNDMGIKDVVLKTYTNDFK